MKEIYCHNCNHKLEKEGVCPYCGFSSSDNKTMTINTDNENTYILGNSHDSMNEHNEDNYLEMGDSDNTDTIIIGDTSDVELSSINSEHTVQIEHENERKYNTDAVMDNNSSISSGAGKKTAIIPALKKISVAVIVMIILSLLGTIIQRNIETIVPTSPFKNNTKYLPKRMDGFSQGGILPEDYKAVDRDEENNFEIYELWGEWVLSEDSKKMLEEMGEGIDCEFPVAGGKADVRISPFPGKLDLIKWGEFIVTRNFGLDYEQLSDFDSDIVDITYAESTGFIFDIDDCDDVSKTLLQQGCGEARIYFDFLEFYYDKYYKDGWSDVEVENLKILNESYLNADNNYLYSSECLYIINGSKLIFGVFDSNPNGRDGIIENGTELLEFVYDYEWKGCELKLTYDDITVSYYPKDLDDLIKGQGHSNYGAMDPVHTLDNIKGLYFNDGHYKIMTDTRTGYEDADVKFGDTTISINGSDYEYCFSGDTLILFDDNDDEHYTYSVHFKARQSPNHYMNAGFCYKNYGIDTYDLTVSDLIDLGLLPSIDSKAMIPGCSTTGELVFSDGNVSMIAKATNNYDYGQPLSDCLVSYVMMDDITGDIWKDNIIMGESDYDAVYFTYSIPYESKPRELVYKTHNTYYEGYTGVLNHIGSGLGNALSRLESFNISDIFNNNVITPVFYDDRDREVIYKFNDDNKLSEIEIFFPSLLYHNIQNNIDTSLYRNVDDATLSVAMDIRNDISAELIREFENQGIQAELDDVSGQLTLNSSILFGFDSHELSDNSREELDKVLKAYSGIILRDDIRDVISEISFEGHTDTTGSYEYNLELSELRAKAVWEHCHEVLTDAEEVFFTEKSGYTGRSFTEPALKEDGTEDSEKSRRVTIKYLLDMDRIAEMKGH